MLDFSNDAIPKDAAIDAPYTQDECDYKEPNDTPDTAAVIMAGDTGPAAICAHAGDAGGQDLDYYKFTVSAAATVTIAIQFTNRPGGDLDLALYNSTGTTMITASRGFGDGETIVCPAVSPPCPSLAAGDYIFEVFPAVTGAVNAYTFSVQ